MSENIFFNSYKHIVMEDFSKVLIAHFLSNHLKRQKLSLTPMCSFIIDFMVKVVSLKIITYDYGSII